MGYTTNFSGEFSISPPLSSAHRAYLQAFSDIRHMDRNEFKLAVPGEFPDPIREAVHLPVGVHGEYYVGSVKDGQSGQGRDPSILKYNDPPPTQPGLWCQWEPDELGDAIRWNGTEKFYDYIEWMEYLLVNFLVPWGYKVNGTVEWQGEDSRDVGRIIIEDSVLRVQRAKLVWEDE